MKKESKTVFILGSGFSYSAGIPTQEKLLDSLSKYYSSSKSTGTSKADWDSFLKYFYKRKIGNKIESYLIEDIFTTFDKCVLDDEGFKGYSSRVMQKYYMYLLNALRHFLIDLVNDSISKQKGAYKSYSKFALMLLNKRKLFNKKDKLSVISLNWDSYFERTILNKMVNFRKDRLDIDYCTYDYSFDNSGKSIPSINKKAKGKINFKYLKPHGSINWGYCQNCGRIYISYGKKIETQYQCIRYCNKKFGKVNLIPFMITPTFLKDISNKHLKDIWSNVGIELSEATNLIFIGYSLRPEDYYFRFMLSKYVDSNTNIYVYDYAEPSLTPLERNTKKVDLESRFENFFQKSIVKKVSIDGWENLIDEIETIII